MLLKSLKITKRQQLENIEINFHERLTILTWANWSGKTTILQHILARHSGRNSKSCSTPRKDKKSGIISLVKRYFNGKENIDDTIGYLEYTNAQKALLQLPKQSTLQYEVQIQNQNQIPCFFIPSHRSIFRYQSIDSIPFGKKNKKTAFQEVANANKQRYFGGSPTNQPSSFFMKNTLISWAYQGYKLIDDNGNQVNTRDEELVKYYEWFKNILKKILPETLAFEDFEIREREIMFICNQGKDEFIFEQVSGGISALIDIAWQIYMFSTKEVESFTVIIDEVENHLHPTIQRKVLPSLLDAFPKACFIVSTHSPLIVGSVQKSNIYALRYDKEKKITSEQLDMVNQAKTATEILDEVLGVSFTMPIWAEEKLNTIVNTYSQKDMTWNEFNSMRNELREIGLEKLLPEAIYDLIEKRNEKDQ